MGLFTGDFYSESLAMTTQLRVIFPELSNDVTPVFGGEPMVLYLLHGLSANSGEWTRFSKIEYYAKKYNFIIVMPEVQRSFYCDSISGPRYFTYIADELPKICEKWFRFDSSRKNTFIAGESMGGYGAVKVGLSRPERFSGIASLSGVLNYPRLARQIYAEYTDLVEPYGMDECWLDVSGSIGIYGDGEKIANKIRERMKFELGLTISAGVSFNKIFAKLGSENTADFAFANSSSERPSTSYLLANLKSVKARTPRL